MYKILLAVDGSEPSARATRALITALREYKAQPQIDVLTVHLPLPNVGTAGSMITKDIRDRYYQEECDAALAPTTKLLDEAGLKYTAHRTIGLVADTIVEKAGEFGSDLIYMGTHGRGGATKLIMGSVANKVLQQTKIPVQLIK